MQSRECAIPKTVLQRFSTAKDIDSSSPTHATGTSHADTPLFSHLHQPLSESLNLYRTPDVTPNLLPWVLIE